MGQPVIIVPPGIVPPGATPTGLGCMKEHSPVRMRRQAPDLAGLREVGVLGSAPSSDSCTLEATFKAVTESVVVVC